MSSGPNVEEILAAVNKSGYLMEQEVATTLESLGFHIWTNWAFEDPDEGKSREVDIRAIKQIAYDAQQGITAFVELIVECKNSTNPYVFISRPKNEMDKNYDPQEFIYPIREYRVSKEKFSDGNATELMPAFFHLGFDRLHHGSASSTKSVQFCRINRKGKNAKWEANHGGLYNSILMPLAKALMVRKNEIMSRRERTAPALLWYFVPMVVTSGEIFLIDSSASSPTPQNQDFVNFQREIRTGQLQGIFAVDFVRQDHITQFYSHCLQPLLEDIAKLTTNDPDYILEQVNLVRRQR